MLLRCFFLAEYTPEPLPPGNNESTMHAVHFKRVLTLYYQSDIWIGPHRGIVTWNTLVYIFSDYVEKIQELKAPLPSQKVENV